jgi:benzoyl-CoA reductase/2-hydroxyglutaryl-CoA dehydratase subunit BcrC/BadD/HgdB
LDKDVLFKFLKIKNEYNKNFSKFSKEKSKPLAWVTSFTPIEILYAMDIDFILPESYAVLLASGGNEQKYIDKAIENNFDPSICSYSTCFNGGYIAKEGPNGVPLEPDILIATNNQCNTLTGWWNYMSNKLEIPLLILDYPGEVNYSEDTENYIINQHRGLIKFIEENTGHVLNNEKLKNAVENSRKSIELWNKILGLSKDYYVSPKISFDYLFPLIISRHKDITVEFYSVFYESLKKELKPLGNIKRVMWMGYPLWYEANRYMDGIDDANINISFNDYSTWWNLEYDGKSIEKALVRAYNFTFLNKALPSRIQIINNMIKEYKIDGVIFNSNKSCKREASVIYPIKEKIDVPSIVISSDMIDRQYMNKENTMLKIDTFKEVLTNVLGN